MINAEKHVAPGVVGANLIESVAQTVSDDVDAFIDAIGEFFDGSSDY